MDQPIVPAVTRVFYHPAIGRVRCFMDVNGIFWFSLMDLLVAAGKDNPRPSDEAKALPPRAVRVIRPVCLGLSELYDGMTRRQRRTVVTLEGATHVAGRHWHRNGENLIGFLTEYMLPVLLNLPFRSDVQQMINDHEATERAKQDVAAMSEEQRAEQDAGELYRCR